MVEVAERDINQTLRVILSRREMECALNILERFREQKTITLCIKHDLKQFTGAQVYFMIRILTIAGLIKHKRGAGKVKLICADKERVEKILRNEQTLSTAANIKSIHSLMSRVQCEALEILSGELINTTNEINIRKFCRVNFFDAGVLKQVFKYLEMANVLAIKSTNTRVTVITVLNRKILNKVVKNITERLDR